MALNPFEVAASGDLFARHLTNKVLTRQDRNLVLYSRDEGGAIYPFKQLTTKWDEDKGGNEIVGWRWEFHCAADVLSPDDFPAIHRVVNGGRIYSLKDKIESRGVEQAYHRLLIEGLNHAETSPLQTGARAYWTFNETGGHAKDLTPNALHLVPAASKPGRTTGKITVGRAATFDGIAKNFSLASDPAINLDGDSFTIAGWIAATDEEAGAEIVARWGASLSGQSWRVGMTGGDLFFQMDNGTTAKTVMVMLPDTDWHFFVVTYDLVTGALKLTLDAGGLGQVDTDTLAGGARAVTTPLQVGGQTMNFYAGMVDALGIWGRILTATEIAWLWNSGYGREWPFWF